MYTVYELVSKIDGKTYIGCTSQSLHRRLANHKSRHATQHQLNYKLYQYTRAHGFGVMEAKEIRRFTDKNRALAYEAKLIRQKGTLNSHHR